MMLLGGTLATFTYYTLWVIMLPFVEEEQEFIHRWFPDRHYAVGLPMLTGVIGLAFIGCFVATVMIKSKKEEKTT